MLKLVWHKTVKIRPGIRQGLEFFLEFKSQNYEESKTRHDTLQLCNIYVSMQNGIHLCCCSYVE